MIVPDKYTNIKYSVINVSAFIIKILSSTRFASFHELQKQVSNALGEEAIRVYPYALNFLFIVNKIKYEKNLDTIYLKDEA